MNFDESVKYLYNLGNEVLAMKLGLENIGKLLAALGDPQNNFLKVQVAGTNGKGSTCAFLDAICAAARIKTGLFTSPHLVSITERIKIGGREISETDFARHATNVRKICEELVEQGELETVPTYFEQVTAIALDIFAESEIELAILETGLGGRFDATTTAKAEIVAITPIDYDHQNILGDSLAKIAREKAAIIRRDTKVVVGKQKDEALKVILERCAAKNVVPVMSRCKVYENDFSAVSFKTENHFYPAVKLSLEGEHQRQNACVAINLAEVLRADFRFEISDQAVIKGLENAEHRGRLEWKKTNGVKILFDGAHNAAGAQALKNYLGKRQSRVTMIFGAMRDKDLSEIAASLFPLADNLILTMPDNPRSMSLEDLHEHAAKFLDIAKIYSVANVGNALDLAFKIDKKYAGAGEHFVCITGSLYLVGEAQKKCATMFQASNDSQKNYE